MNFIKRFQNFIFHEKILPRGSGIVVAVSGGSDSVCLAKLLLNLAKKHNWKLHLAHVNYGARGEDSVADENFIRDLARKESVDLTVFDFKKSLKSVKSIKLLRKAGEKFNKNGNQEEIFRNFRYEKFEELRNKLSFDWICVAHTKDDLAETFFINFLRGCGLDGLVSLKVKNNFIIRPLLNFTKQECLDFLSLIKQDFRTDQSNFDQKFRRNQIRYELIPFLEKNYNPNLKENIKKLWENLALNKDLIDNLVEKKFRLVILKSDKISDKKKVVIDLKKFKKLPENLQSLVFRRLIKELKGNLKNISQKHWFEFKKIVDSSKSKRQKLEFGGLKLEARSERFEIEN